MAVTVKELIVKLLEFDMDCEVYDRLGFEPKVTIGDYEGRTVIL
jgi:hypothetical protein